MIKFLIILILVMVVAVSGALVLLEDPGYALFSYSGIMVETTLSMLLITFFVAIIGVVIFIRLVKLTVLFPDLMYAKGQKHRQKRVQQYYCKGMRALAEGHWKKAEKLLVESAKHSELPLLNYLSAARAAQHQGFLDRRDHYLSLAAKSDENAEFATELTQAELQIKQGQLEQALATLNLLAEKEPNNLFIMEMLLALYKQLGEWENLKEKLPEFKKLGIIDANEAEKLELDIALELIRSGVKQEGVTTLLSDWESLTKKQKNNDELVQEYVKQLLKFNEDDKAERLLRDAIKRTWKKSLVYLYGQVNSEKPDQQLKLAEGWVKSHGDDAVVNLSLGRICMLNRLWGKARIYLEKSIELGARAETYFELGALLEHLDDKEAAMLCYRNGLKLAVSDIDAHVPDFGDAEIESEIEEALTEQ